MAERPGVLYVVATPIGNLDDLSTRAREVLAAADWIAAEDTRHSGALLAHLGIRARFLSLHDHNESERTPQLLEELTAGKSVALISDAGTPLISDPGYDLVRAAHAAGIRVSPIPGACALVAALSVAGLPTDRFAFEGFLPAKNAARRERLTVLAGETRTLVFYESVHRLAESLADMVACIGAGRRAAVARELTKLHEELRPGTLVELASWAQRDAAAGKGEAVVILAGAEKAAASGHDAEGVLKVLLAELPVKQAATLAAKITGEKKNDLYERALELSGKR